MMMLHTNVYLIMLKDFLNQESLKNYPAKQMTLAKEAKIQCAFFNSEDVFRVKLFNTFFGRTVLQNKSNIVLTKVILTRMNSLQSCFPSTLGWKSLMISKR